MEDNRIFARLAAQEIQLEELKPEEVTQASGGMKVSVGGPYYTQCGNPYNPWGWDDCGQ